MRTYFSTVLVCLALCGLLVACGDEGGGGDGGGAGSGPVLPDYHAVSKILGGPEQQGIGKCAASSCHAGSGSGKANLNFKMGANLVELLVDVPACENNSMMLVKPGSPDESWLWIKLTADINNTTEGKILFEGTPSTCPGVSEKAGFGTRMPQAIGTFNKLPDHELAVIRAWIEAGAPGPE